MTRPSRIERPSSNFPLRAVQRRPVGISEPSDVTALPGGRAFIVGDLSHEASVVGFEGGAEQRLSLPLPLANGTKGKKKARKGTQEGLEGVAFDPASRSLFVAREETREIMRLVLSPDATTATLKGQVTLDLGGKKNKGLEGLAFLAADLSPNEKDVLLVAKEGDPCMLMAMDPTLTGRPRTIALDDTLLARCTDFAALAVHPQTGNVWIGSEEAACVAEVALSVNDAGEWTARTLGTHSLESEGGEPLARVEGLTFDEAGRLWVLQEDARQLLRVEPSRD